MRDFWTFIGGVAVGILAVTGVFVMEEDEKPSSVEHDEDDELEGQFEEEMDDDGRIIVRAS